MTDIIDNVFNHPPISYEIYTDDDKRYLHIHVGGNGETFETREKQMDNFYDIVNFDKRWRNFSETLS